MKELIEALELGVEMLENNYFDQSKFNMMFETLKKAKQKEAIESSTNWQMESEAKLEQDGKTEQLSAEEFLKSKVIEFKTSMSYYYSFSGHELSDLLTEFKNQ